VRLLFVWDPKHSVGNTEVDRQHAHILELINVVERAAVSGEGKDTVDVVVGHLVRYVGLHFRSEEELMAMVGYPSVETHQHEHHQCLVQLEEFAKANDDNRLNLKELATYLREWLLTHTFFSDRLFVPYVNRCPDRALAWAEEAHERLEVESTS
jgi:hemerythrin-like metal-binding protein